MRDVAILSAVRSPIGRAPKGSLRNTRPDDLAALVVREALVRASVEDASVGDLILGCAQPEREQGFNLARLVALLGGLPHEVPAMTVNRLCASGLQAVALAADRIACGGLDVAVAGGVESMTMVPLGAGPPSPNPALAHLSPDALSMGHTAEALARRFGISREEQDAFALDSHRKAIAAWAAGRMTDEVVSVATRVQREDGERTSLIFDRDECPRADTSQEALAALRPAFRIDGTVTAGNSSPRSDGAAALVLMDAGRARSQGLKPRAYFRAFTVVGVDPALMGIGPVPAVRKLLASTGLASDDIELYELNEAFAVQALYCIRELGLPADRVNVNGGAIALGHPLGATGARQITTALHELERRKGRWAVVTMCVGLGMGAAGLIERA
jgi:acetyl-CoA acyltransferase